MSAESGVPASGYEGDRQRSEYVTVSFDGGNFFHSERVLRSRLPLDCQGEGHEVAAEVHDCRTCAPPA